MLTGVTKRGKRFCVKIAIPVTSADVLNREYLQLEYKYTPTKQTRNHEKGNPNPVNNQDHDKNKVNITTLRKIPQ